MADYSDLRRRLISDNMTKTPGKIEQALVVSEGDKKFVRDIYKVDEETIKRDVEILKNWIKQQKHLPQTADDGFLERCLLNNKFRIETTKRKLDNYYTMRGIHRKYFQTDNSKFLPSKSKMAFVPFPRLTPEKHRLIYTRFDPDPATNDQVDFIKFQNLFYELLLKYDYASGMRFIFDCEGLTMEHAKKCTVADFANLNALYQKCYSGRLVRLDLINAPKHVNVFMAILKLALPAKFYAKFHITEDKEALLSSLPKECLPVDFGGHLESLEDLTKNYWDPIFLDHMDFFQENLKNVSDESLRVGEPPNTGLYGVDGTFKELRVD